MSEKMKNIPKFRFPEFLDDGEWEEVELELLSLKISDGIHSTPVYDDNGDYYFINGNNLIDGIIIIDEKTKRVSKEEYEKHKRVLNQHTILLSINGTIGNISTYNHEKVVLGKSACYININDKKANQKFIINFLKTSKVNNFFTSELTGSTIKNLSLKTVKNTIIDLPSLNEQQKIADCLSSIDSLISAQSKKIELLKEHKNGLLQNLFPKDGENIPKIRFPEFVNDVEWEEKKLGDLLDYEQPTNYLVSDTKYDDSYKIPVLTAGKTFILGYTDETNGVFENPLPVIIFDDFTTATQFVDFPFKAKSSAMKILKAKSDKSSMKLIFELIQMINYQAEEHKRYWISEYQNLIIKLPKFKEQQKIANCLTSIDEQINLQIQKVESLKEHKKALLQQLFPSNEVNK
jgi:type I restriction enzyme S subunit